MDHLLIERIAKRKVLNRPKTELKKTTSFFLDQLKEKARAQIKCLIVIIRGHVLSVSTKYPNQRTLVVRYLQHVNVTSWVEGCQEKKKRCPAPICMTWRTGRI